MNEEMEAGNTNFVQLVIKYMNQLKAIEPKILEYVEKNPDDLVPFSMKPYRQKLAEVRSLMKLPDSPTPRSNILKK